MSPLVSIAPVVLAASSADPVAPVRLADLARLEFTASPGARQPAAGGGPQEFDDRPVPPFGTKDSLRWNVHGGFGFEFEDADNRFGLLGGGVSYFIVENMSLVLELNLVFFDQVGGHEAFGGNFNLLARWHFLAGERWSVYVDGGAGLMGTTDEVPGPTVDEPRGASQFNFTPQAGFGATFEVDEDMRVLVGVRWHHISNARTSEVNPGRDSLLVYAGLSLPF